MGGDLQFTSAPCHPPVFNMPGPAPSGTNVGSSGVLSQQSSGGPGSRIHRQAEEECQLWNTERRPYDLSGHWMGWRKKWWNELGDLDWHIYTTMYKIDKIGRAHV